MRHTATHPLQINSLPPDTVQAYLDALAALSARYGIVIDSGSLRPMDGDIGGYLLTTGGYLGLYPLGDRMADVIRDNLSSAPGRCDPYTRVSDIAGLSAHDLIRLLRKL
jgi:hypothetical protein